MATQHSQTIDVRLPTDTEELSKTKIQLLPCTIDFNGSAKLSEYFVQEGATGMTIMNELLN